MQTKGTKIWVLGAFTEDKVQDKYGETKEEREVIGGDELGQISMQQAPECQCA